MEGRPQRFPLSIPETIVAVPFFHVLVASLFLVGYHAAYGFRISTFAGPSDLFSVSISDVGPAYILTLAIPITYLFYSRGKHGAWTLVEAVDKKEGEDRQIALAELKSWRKFLLLLLTIVLVGQIVMMAVYAVRFGYITYSLFYIPVLVAFMLGHGWISTKMEIPGLTFNFIFLSGALLIAAGFNGLSAGQSDRRMKYSDVSRRLPLCSDAAVLRPLSSFYLAVREGGQRVIIDADCSTKFSLGNP